MKTSDSITKLAPALLNAQRSITFAAKDALNPHFKSTYAGLPSVIDAAKPALNDAGIVFIQTPSPSDDGKLHLTTRLIHESGEWLEDTAVCPLPKADPQGFGSALTYLRRYALAAAVGLYQDDDDGNAASGEAPTERRATAPTKPQPQAEQSSRPAASGPITAKTMKEISSMLGDGDLATLTDRSLDKLGVIALSDLYQEEGDKLLAALNAKVAKRGAK